MKSLIMAVLLCSMAGSIYAQNGNIQSAAKTNKIMEQRLSFITLGAKNLDELKRFYMDKFKWTPFKDDQGIVFFKMNGFILSLFPADELAKDAGVPPEGTGFKKMTLAICYRSEKEVDDVFKALQGRGVKIVKAPRKVFWGGYSCYVADIEDNLWEIAYNPFLDLDKDGNVLPQN